MNPFEQLADVCDRLQSDPLALPWSERQEIARALAEQVASGGTLSDRALELVSFLTADPKWEVRREIADALRAVPDAEFPALASRLANDTNQLVREAAKKAMDRRREIARQVGNTRQIADEITQAIAAVERDHGRKAAQRVQRICDRYMQIVMGAVVHDLRSLATHLETHCDALIDEVGKRRRASQRVRENLDLLTRMLRDMELFTQPIPTERHRERIADVVRAAIDMARDNVQHDGVDGEAVSVRVDVPDNLTAEVCRHRLVMSLANLLKNAFESFVQGDNTIRQGEINVRAVLLNDYVEIQIADNGQGIAQEEYVGRSLFVPGRRNKSKRNSTGHGLANAARAVAAHGGTLTIQSRVDEGTTIRVTLPVNAEGASS